MTKRDEAMERRIDAEEARLIAQDQSLQESIGRFLARLHPRDRRGKFRETFGAAEVDMESREFARADEARRAESKFSSSRWQLTHAGGGGITDKQGEYVHGWAGRMDSGRFSATLTHKSGMTVRGEGASPIDALDNAREQYLAGGGKRRPRAQSEEVLQRRLAAARPGRNPKGPQEPSQLHKGGVEAGVETKASIAEFTDEQLAAKIQAISDASAARWRTSVGGTAMADVRLKLYLAEQKRRAGK